MLRRPRIIPVLSIIENDLVKTKQFQAPRYLGDPINAVKIFNGKMVDELCVLDIRATQTNQPPNFELLKDIAAQAFMPLAYGGGLQSIDQVKAIIKMGYEKVIFNSALWSYPDVVKESAKTLGTSGVVASIDVRFVDDQYVPMIQSGEVQVPLSLEQFIEHVISLGVGEIIISSIDRDSMMEGYDLTLIERISQTVGVPLIALGGAHHILDLKKAIQAGAQAAGASSMFVYFGPKQTVLITHPSQTEIDRLWEDL
jgi:imidazole glycerol-phosphate synthase subunit HisF